MGLFDDTTSKKNEVRIGVPDEKEGDDSKLRSEVESKIDTSSTPTGSSSRDSTSSSEVSRKELHRQNERIINLLEKLVDDEGVQNNTSRVTDRNNDDSGMRGGMDELL